MRLSAMGDVAMTVHAVRALREAYPQLRITILTRPFFKPFFGGVDRIEFFDPDLKGRHKGFGGLVRLFRDLEKLDIDFVADMHDVLRTKIVRTLFCMTKTRVAVIDKGRSDKKALTRKFRKLMHQLKHMVERYCEVLSALGFSDLELTPVPATPAALPPQIRAITGEKSGKWVGIAPFAKHKGKIYPSKQADELIGMLCGKAERVFIFGGGPYEKDFAECMEERYENVVSVIGKLSLSQEFDLISNLECIVTMDSASMHMASLVGTPAVSVWGATHPYAGFYGFGQDPDNAVQLDLPCRPCSVFGNKPCMYGDFHCMTGIEPSQIVDRVLIASLKSNE